jgi:hypothetical protein
MRWRIGAADVDDAATVLHMLGRSLRGHEHGAHVDGDGFVEVFQREAVGWASSSTPALLTRMSRRPKRSATLSMALVRAAASLASA